jgi:hypothetical protein
MSTTYLEYLPKTFTHGIGGGSRIDDLLLLLLKCLVEFLGDRRRSELGGEGAHICTGTILHRSINIIDCITDNCSEFYRKLNIKIKGSINII